MPGRCPRRTPRTCRRRGTRTPSTEPPGGREPERVVQQVEQDLVEPLPVGQHVREVAGDLLRYATRRRRGPSAPRRSRVDERRQRDRLASRASRRPTRASTDRAAAPRGGSAARTAGASPASSRRLGSSTPSSMFSRCARRAEIGVFSSWETFATRSRRSRSMLSSSVAIRLNVSASCAELVPRGHRHAFGVVAAGQPLGRARHVADRLRHARAQQPREDERDRRRGAPASSSCH